MSSIAVPVGGVSAEAIAEAEVRVAVDPATAVSFAPMSAAAAPASLERTTSRCGVSAAGLPGWLPLGGLPPEPEDMDVSARC